MILPLWAPSYRSKNIGKILDALIERGARPTVFAEEGPHSADLRAWRAQIDAVFFPRGASRMLSFLRLIIAHRFDIVLWTYSGYHENALLAAMRPFGGPPYVIKSDSRVGHDGVSLRRYLGRTLFFRWPAGLADLILVETAEVRRRAESAYGRVRLHLFPNGVDLQKFRAEETALASEPAPLPAPFVLYTGRLARDKGVDVLIEAFAMAAASRPEWKLAVIGPDWDADYANSCRERAHELLGGRAVFVEEQHGRDLLRWYKTCAVYALPSRHEGLPNRLPEAMFFGKPIVACGVGQIAALVDDKVGIIVPPDDAPAFGAALGRLMDDAAVRERLGRESRRRVEDGLDDRDLLPDLLDRCEKLLR